MSSIVRITESKLRNEEHVQLNESVILLVNVKAEESFGIAALVVPYKAAFVTEKEALEYVRKSELTARIVEKDGVRGAIYRGFLTTVKGSRNHFNPEMRVAANALWHVFEAYGDLTDKNFDAETTAIDDLLEELKKPALAAAMKTLGVEDWAAELGVENMRFQELLLERSAEIAQKGAHQMRVARRETDRYFRAILAVLESHVLLGNQGEAFDSFVSDLNAIIGRFKNRLAKEYGRKNSAAGPEAEGSARSGEEGPEAGAAQGAASAQSAAAPTPSGENCPCPE